jgi:hypothetical protein
MNDALPKDGIGDDVHRGVRAVLSAIPFAGGAAVELFNRLLAPPIQRRRDAWLNDIAERLAAMEQEGRVSVEKLSRTDEFVSTVMQASQAAVRNHQREKLDALRNAVLNSALGHGPEDAKREMFLALIDSFGVWHLRALAFLGDPDGWVRQHGIKMQENLICKSVDAALYNQFGELYREPDFRRALIQDLRGRSLIQNSDAEFEFAAATTGRRTAATTALGREFLRFVTDPEGTT